MEGGGFGVVGFEAGLVVAVDVLEFEGEGFDALAQGEVEGEAEFVGAGEGWEGSCGGLCDHAWKLAAGFGFASEEFEQSDMTLSVLKQVTQDFYASGGKMGEMGVYGCRGVGLGAGRVHRLCMSALLSGGTERSW